MDSRILGRAVINAFFTAAYISGVALCLFYVPKYIGETTPESVLVPIMILSLLVFSVAVTGSLIFGAPILWYLDGRKREALDLLIWTLCFLLVFVFVVLIVLLI